MNCAYPLERRQGDRCPECGHHNAVEVAMPEYFFVWMGLCCIASGVGYGLTVMPWIACILQLLNGGGGDFLAWAITLSPCVMATGTLVLLSAWRGRARLGGMASCVRATFSVVLTLVPPVLALLVMIVG